MATPASNVTPRRSPRIVTIRSKSATTSTITTPVRDSLRRLAGNCAILDGTRRYIEQEPSYSSLNTQLVKAEVGGNKLKQFLVVVRKLKSYDCKIGPYDAMKFVVRDNGTF